MPPYLRGMSQSPSGGTIKFPEVVRTGPSPKERRKSHASGISASSGDLATLPDCGLKERKGLMRAESAFAELGFGSLRADRFASVRDELIRYRAGRTEELRALQLRLHRSEAHGVSLTEDLALARVEVTGGKKESDRLAAESACLQAQLARQADNLSEAERRHLEASVSVGANAEAEAKAEAEACRMREVFESEMAAMRVQHAGELAANRQTISNLTGQLADAVSLERCAADRVEQEREAARIAQAAAAQSESEALAAGQRLKRCEGVQERQAQDAERFAKHLAEGVSAEPPLAKAFDLDTMKVLGMGAYGFVVSCQPKSGAGCGVVKLMGERWAGLALKEWAHGTSCIHSHIVKYGDCYLHHDYGIVIKGLLQAAFADGTLAGREPQFLPRNYFCLTMEHMDRGTVHGLIAGRQLTLESAGAVTRQVASALAYMHKLRRTHNDVKPENILLQSSGDGDPDHLVAKLGDFGLADHSLDRGRDCELLAYSAWCMITGRTFDRCPAPGAERQEALEELLKTGAAAASCGAQPACSAKRLLRSLGEAVGNLWRMEADMASVERVETLQGLEIWLPRQRKPANSARSAGG